MKTIMVQQFLVAIQLQMLVIHALAKQHVMHVLIVQAGHSHQGFLVSPRMVVS